MDTHLLGGLAAHATAQYGIFTRQQAMACGYPDGEIRQRTREHTWYRLRRGVYTEQARWDRLSPAERHMLEVRAALLHVDEPAVASHWSAATLLQLDMHEPDLAVVHLTRGDSHSPRREGGIHHHAGRLDPEEIVVVGGIQVTCPARTVVDLARLPAATSYHSALVAADSALRSGLDPERLRAQLLTQTDWPGARTAARVVVDADGRSESVGETLCRAALTELGLPCPELQTEVPNRDGSVFARTDFYWPGHRTVAEFDGKVKYFRGGQDVEVLGDQIWREKRREDRLRSEYGLEVVRIVWADLLPGSRIALAHRIRAAFSRAASRGLVA